MSENKYKRVLLKISGEVLGGSKESGIDFDLLQDLADEVKFVYEKGIQVVMVIGAGNIWRYRDFKDTGIERVISDNMGMMATIMNSVAFQSALEQMDVECRVCSAINIPQLAEPFLRRKSIRHLEKGRVVICAGGTGNPYFTTDSAAALRALELGCDVLLKATNVDGVYDSDPNVNKDATLYEEVSFSDVLKKNLKVMDAAAISLCRDGKLPIRVFNLNEKENIVKASCGENVGTLVSI